MPKVVLKPPGYIKFQHKVGNYKALFSVWGWEMLQNSTTLTAEIGHLMILFPQHEILNFLTTRNFLIQD